MGLERLQHALAKLYTDAALRADFIADPDGTATNLGLSLSDTKQLNAASLEQIERFAHSLCRKRADEVRRLLPYTCRALGKSFGRIFLTYSDTFCPQGFHKHQDDALQFVVYLSHNARCLNVTANMIDVARFESAALRISQCSGRFFVRLFRHDVRQSIREIETGQQDSEVTFRLSVGIWFRIGLVTRFRFVVFPPFLSSSSNAAKLNHLS